MDAKNALRKYNWEKYANKFSFEITTTGLTIEPDTRCLQVFILHSFNM